MGIIIENVGRPLVGLQGSHEEKSSFPIRRPTRGLPTFFHYCSTVKRKQIKTFSKKNDV